MSEQKTTAHKAQRSVVGKVVSDKMNKTLVVEVVRTFKHSAYGKYIKRFSKMYAHDEENTGRIGDTVRIQQSRPLSKTKRWVLVEVLARGEEQQ